MSQNYFLLPGRKFTITGLPKDSEGKDFNGIYIFDSVYIEDGKPYLYFNKGWQDRKALISLDMIETHKITFELFF